MSGAAALLNTVFGFDSFRPGQEEIVDAVTDGHNVLAIGSKLFAIREDRINLTPSGNSQVKAIEFLGANVKLNVAYGKNGNLTVSQSDVAFAKSKIEIGDNVKVSWSKKNQLELENQENNSS